jgi:protein kinase A
VDWYALGNLIFEMLSGWPAFLRIGDTPAEVYVRVKRGIDAIEWPTWFSPLARNIVVHLLQPDPAARLGNLSGGANDVFEHDWFREVPWEKIRNRQLVVPFLPQEDGITGGYYHKVKDDSASGMQYGLDADDPHGLHFPNFAYTSVDSKA